MRKIRYEVVWRGETRKRVLIINPEEGAEHIHPVELRDELFNNVPDETYSLEHFISCVKTHFQRIKSMENKEVNV